MDIYFLEAHLHSVSEAHLQSAPQEQPDAYLTNSNLDIVDDNILIYDN